MSVSYEIDFLHVGEGKRSGDAICIRYGSPGNYRVLVYDGGTASSGAAIVQHIREHYGTNVVDDVVCSHPDPDHAAGLSVVLENMVVLSLWMHRPWTHSSVIGRYVREGRIADARLARRIRNMARTYALEEIAARKRIRLREPFQGELFGEFMVLSPNRHWYEERLIAEFDRAPASNGHDAGLIGLPPPSAESAGEAARHAGESWCSETLREDARTSFENESSVVLLGTLADRGVMLTGDAGVVALNNAIDFAEVCGILLRYVLRFVQIPGHGNREHVSPEVLDRLLGSKLRGQPTRQRITAFVSAAKQPHKETVNAFIRRGVKVVATNGTPKCHFFNMDSRARWRPAPPLQFSGDAACREEDACCERMAPRRRRARASASHENHERKKCRSD